MEICDEVGWLSYERKRTERKQGHPLWLLANYLEVRNVDLPFCSVVCDIPGTPATVTQLAKDVCTFLKWAAGERFFLFCHFREVKSVCHLPKNFGNFSGKCHRVKNVCNFTFVSLSLFKIQGGRTDIALNCLDLANSSENFKVELVFPLEKFPTGELHKEPDKEGENRTNWTKN